MYELCSTNKLALPCSVRRASGETYTICQQRGSICQHVVTHLWKHAVHLSYAWLHTCGLHCGPVSFFFAFLFVAEVSFSEWNWQRAHLFQRNCISGANSWTQSCVEIFPSTCRLLLLKLRLPSGKLWLTLETDMLGSAFWTPAVPLLNVTEKVNLSQWFMSILRLSCILTNPNYCFHRDPRMRLKEDLTGGVQQHSDDPDIMLSQTTDNRPQRQQQLSWIMHILRLCVHESACPPDCLIILSSTGFHE